MLSYFLNIYSKFQKKKTLFPLLTQVFDFKAKIYRTHPIWKLNFPTTALHSTNSGILHGHSQCLFNFRSLFVAAAGQYTEWTNFCASPRWYLSNDHFSSRETSVLLTIAFWNEGTLLAEAQIDFQATLTRVLLGPTYTPKFISRGILCQGNHCTIIMIWGNHMVLATS